MALDRIGYLNGDQFVREIAPAVGGELSGTFQPLDATLTDLASRNIGAAAATDILDRAAGDGRYLLGASYTAADILAKLITVDGPGSGIDADTIDGTNPGAFGLTLLATANLAAAKAALAYVKGDVGLGSADNTADAAKNVLTATKLVTARTIAISGKATGTATSFDGSANITIPITAITLVAGDIPTIAQSQVTNLVTDLAAKASKAGDTFTGMITSTAAGSTTTPQLYLNGATNNWIAFNTNGSAPPAFTTRSLGTKIVLYPALTGSAADTAIGIDTNTAWISGATTGVDFKYYGGTTLAATLTGLGDVRAVRSVKSGSFTVATLPSAATVGSGSRVYASNARKSGEGAGAGTGIPVWTDGTNWRTYYDNAVAAA